MRKTKLTSLKLKPLILQKTKYMAAPYILSETPWKTVQEISSTKLLFCPGGLQKPIIIIFPLEPTILKQNILPAWRLRRHGKKEYRVVVLPVIPFGVNTGQLDIYMTMNMNPGTQLKILEDVLTSLSNHNISKLVVFNGHGGNDFKTLIRELQPRYPEIFMVQLNWFEVVPLNQYFEETGDHANEMETSVMMHIVPIWFYP